MSLVDWMVIAAHRSEYAIRGAVCFVLGHRWEPQYIDAGDQQIHDCDYCLRCHLTDLAASSASGAGDETK